MTEANTSMKPLALLIPGLDGTGLLFYRQLDALSARHRACPWRFGTKAGFDLSDLTREIGDRTAGEAGGSILVVGESFGGLVALSYVLHFPERVQRLILVNAFPYYRRQERIRLARALVPFMNLKLGRLVKNYVVDRTLLGEGILKEDRRRYHDIVSQVDPAAYRRRLELVQKVDLRPKLGEIAVPTVLLASGRDKIVPSIAEARFMAERIPRAQVHEFPDAGHALLLTPGVSLADYVTEEANS